MSKNNHNSVKVEIPIAGEYILRILDHMLIVKCISDKTYQYSEFMNIGNKYIMTSVNCKTGNILRVMEEFCKSHNCPKRVLHDTINNVEKSVRNESVDSKTVDKLKTQLDKVTKEHNSILETNNELRHKLSMYEEVMTALKNGEEIFNNLISNCGGTFSDIVNKINSVYNDLKTFNTLLAMMSSVFDTKEKEENAAEQKSVKPTDDKHHDTGDNIERKTTDKKPNILDKSDVVNCRSSYPSDRKNTKYTRNNPITKDDAKIMLELWKTMTAKEIAEEMPMYTDRQIGQYCTTHSNFAKIGTSKNLLANLKSYNGTKTLKEMGKLTGNPPSKIKRICAVHNIPYVEE